jgi:hypothetical protein
MGRGRRFGGGSRLVERGDMVGLERAGMVVELKGWREVMT